MSAQISLLSRDWWNRRGWVSWSHRMISSWSSFVLLLEYTKKGQPRLEFKATKKTLLLLVSNWSAYCRSMPIQVIQILWLWATVLMMTDPPMCIWAIMPSWWRLDETHIPSISENAIVCRESIDNMEDTGNSWTLVWKPYAQSGATMWMLSGSLGVNQHLTTLISSSLQEAKLSV
jgi:hypothetical protein